MMSYQWTINGRNYDQTEPLTVKEGDRARLTFTNMTMMWHPMHLHGAYVPSGSKVTAVSALDKDNSHRSSDGICPLSISSPTTRATGCSTATTDITRSRV